MRFGILAVAATLAVTSASFGAVMWTPSSGATGGFTYTNGQNATGSLGTPGVSTVGLEFLPAGFKSTAANGASTSVTDTGSVELTAAPGLRFASLAVDLLGDFTISGTGTANSVATLTVTNLDTSTPLTKVLTFTGTPAATATSTDGAFVGSGTLALPDGWTHVRVALSNTLTSTAGSNSSTLIQTKLADVNFTLGAIVPEPATLGAALGAIGLLARRRQR